MIIIYFMLLFSLGSATSFDEFESFMKTFSKSYDSPEELGKRRTIFMQNYQEVKEHNARYEEGKVSWTKKVNKYTDYTKEEFIEARIKGRSKIGVKKDRNHYPCGETTRKNYTQLPNYFSWVDQGGVTPVKDQEECGSCAAFATIAPIETCFWQKTGNLVSLSEQHILDCAYGDTFEDPNPEGNPPDGSIMDCYGCDGAWPQCYYNWIVTEEIGFQTQRQDNYPYQAYTDGECHSTEEGYYKEAIITGMFNLFCTTEEEMQELVLMNPVTTDIEVTDNMGDYASGVYEDERCCKWGTDGWCDTNHSVTVVGWGTDKQTGKDYWLVKNSWGDWFGEDGYIRIKRGTGECGIGRCAIVMPYCEKV